MKTILLPLQFDSNTISTLENAKPIAKEMDASLILLHVVSKQPYDNGTFSHGTDVLGQVRREAQLLLEQFSRQAFSQGIRTRTMVVEGNAAELILNTARQSNADMIVMGRPGTSDPKTRETVLSSAPCPVLTLENRLAKTATKAKAGHRSLLAAA
jgi:nucleotide-binding universal stress UspA family protein